MATATETSMADSWLSGVQRLRIPRPKMTVPPRHSAGQEAREARLLTACPMGARPADPPRDYNLSDADEPMEIKAQSNCCKNVNNMNNNNNQQPTANFA